MSQSEFEAKTGNRRKARENGRVQVAIGFGLPSHWLKKVAPLSQTNHRIRECKTKANEIYVRCSIENRSKISKNKAHGENRENRVLGHRRTARKIVFPVPPHWVDGSRTIFLPKFKRMLILCIPSEQHAAYSVHSTERPSEKRTGPKRARIPYILTNSHSEIVP